jgi:7-cyano-7-deazaguanine synthase
MTLTKAQIITEGARLGLNYGLTLSCYDPTPEGLACGRCDSCQLRLKGFAEAGLRDPLPYFPG